MSTLDSPSTSRTVIQLPLGLFRALCFVSAIGAAVPLLVLTPGARRLVELTDLGRGVLGVVALLAFYVLLFPMAAALAYSRQGRIPPLWRYVVLSLLGTLCVFAFWRLSGSN
ncbi:MAG: hypothetical protein IPJ17_06575 [Holophagales bacterium]|nr:MAG: hypothetical protein IPJ17_06575 [Holophagales bacterium]